jgi:hypothetical protein
MLKAAQAKAPDKLLIIVLARIPIAKGPPSRREGGEFVVVEFGVVHAIGQVHFGLCPG